MQPRPNPLPGPDNVPIGNLYPEPETKTEDNPQVPDWFIMMNEELIQQAPVQSTSPLDPIGLSTLWTSQGSPGMFNQALGNLMIEHPAFAFVPSTSTLTLTIYILLLYTYHSYTS